MDEYISAAMRHAAYTSFDDGTVYAEIPALRGVWANEATRAATEAELRSALADWIHFRIANYRPIPAIDGVSIDIAAAR